MASGGDVAGAVGDLTGDLTDALTLNDAPARPSEVTATWLDTLPLEILEKVANWLDWPSRLSLKNVSAHCRDAVGLFFGRLHAVEMVFWSAFGHSHVTLRFQDTDGNDYELRLTDPAELTEVASQLASVRELHIRKLPSMWLKALSAASRYWTQLEQLELDEWWCDSSPSSSDFALLSELCANCPLLDNVTLRDCGGGDAAVVTVVAARPGLRALHVKHDCTGRFLLELPVGLRELSIDCSELRSEAVTQLARLSELRSLTLASPRHLRAKHLRAGLAGCISLERLVLTNLKPLVNDCLPAAGLPTLRHLELKSCCLTDAGMGHLVERLQGLDSFHLIAYNKALSTIGLAHLSRLPALRSLKLWNKSIYDSLTDWTLAKLSSAPLVELELTDDRDCFSSITPGGLLKLTRACPTLRMVTLRSGNSVQRIECGPGVDGGDLLRMFRASLSKVQFSSFDDCYGSYHEYRGRDPDDSDYDHGFYCGSDVYDRDRDYD